MARTSGESYLYEGHIDVGRMSCFTLYHKRADGVCTWVADSPAKPLPLLLGAQPNFKGCQQLLKCMVWVVEDRHIADRATRYLRAGITAIADAR